MTLSLSEEKLIHIIQQCQQVYSQHRTSVLSLTELTGLLTLIVQAMLPGKIQFCFLQRGQIFSLKKQGVKGVCYSWKLNHTRTSVLDREPKAIQWQKINRRNLR